MLVNSLEVDVGFEVRGPGEAGERFEKIFNEFIFFGNGKEKNLRCRDGMPCFDDKDVMCK